MNCWECKYQQRGGDVFLGYCRYWEQLGEEKKEIPKGALSLLQGRFDKDLELLKEFVDFDVSRWARNAR